MKLGIIRIITCNKDWNSPVLYIVGENNRNVKFQVWPT